MKYPGRVIEKGETDTKIIKALQNRLQALGIEQFEGVGAFGPKTERAVKLFQARFTDALGNPLVIDGKVGSITWEALFGQGTVPEQDEPKNKATSSVIEIAKAEIGVMEDPPGSNWGPRVKEYLNSVDLNIKAPWCMAFVYWCFQQAANTLGKGNPLVKTGGVLNHWNKTTGKKIAAKEAVDNPGLVKPGHIFIMDFGKGAGHTGIVESVTGGFIKVIEGNTNEGGSREGIGVFARTRKIASINKGFIEYKI
ncbi:MAG TPA: CHAP domain-containing protein [Phnomibacter sp.]|nr:CHAP domain-containing protein [Phnomibacter sp.]